MHALHLLAICVLAGGGPPGLSLELNLPAYRLDVLRDGVVERTFEVAIGTRSHPTPTGSYAISTVEWNPWWHPPDSEWARDRVVTPPGPSNPMGVAKLHFRPLYFIHGTPDARSIGSAASHGCVRMRDPEVTELGLLISGRDRPPAGTRLDRVETAIPLEIVYERVELRGGELLVHPDPYRRGGDLRGAAALLAAEAGLRVPTDALEGALREVARTGRSARVGLVPQAEAP
jgi:murein L,D-transpeptidase YcbB/YkuD